MTSVHRLYVHLDIVAQVRALLNAGIRPPFTLLTNGAGNYRVVKES